MLHVSGAKILEAVIPNAKATVMDAVGHLPMIEKPKETAEFYLSFLEQREPNLRYARARIADGGKVIIQDRN